MKRLVCGYLVLLAVAGTWTVGRAAEDPGQTAYDGHCRECHGAEGRGGKGPRLVPFIWSTEQALDLIRQPECDMPAIPASQLSDTQVAQIVAYLKSVD